MDYTNIIIIRKAHTRIKVFLLTLIKYNKRRTAGDSSRFPKITSASVYKEQLHALFSSHTVPSPGELRNEQFLRP